MPRSFPVLPGRSAAALLLLSAPAAMLQAQSAKWQLPPKAILDVVDVERPPVPMPDPSSRHLVLLKRGVFQTLEELAQPELRLAGLRINPANHNAARTRYYTGLSLQELESGRAIPVSGLPGQVRMEYVAFSPGGKYLSFVEVQPRAMVLWVVELATGQARRLGEPLLSAVGGRPYVWSPDEKAVYCRMRPTAGSYTEAQTLPQGPSIQDASGVKAPARTYQDLLRSPADEKKFAFYATTEIVRVGMDGSAAKVLPPAIYRGVAPSPDGNFLLVGEVHAPFSYLFPVSRFPYRVRVTDAQGRTVADIVDKPLQDRIPVDNDAAEDGRRDFEWRADRPATLVWAEALDGGDPAKAAEWRDAVYQLEAPFKGEPRQLCRTRYRYEGVQWGDEHLAVVSEGWWKTRSSRRTRVDPATGNPEPKVIFEYSTEDVYKLPGDFIQAPNAQNRMVLRFTKDRKGLYLEGEGYGPEGNRPFLEQYDLASGKRTRLWQADGKGTYEAFYRLVDPERKLILTSIQGPKLYPNLHLRTYGGARPAKAITSFANPYKAMEGVTRQLIKYKREDGVELSANLYLPPGYDAARDGRLPLLLEAYPTEFKDKGAAGQLRESPHMFVAPYWGSPIYWALRGYAVMEGASFPIVGQGKAEPNDTYIEQLVADARAAIQEGERMGVVDPKRCACVGHSYGAFMVANLLAHSDLFKAGIARSGAYNRTLTPFGFQSEERNYWQAMEVYNRMSPFNYAGNIKGALLMIHGDADANPGTFTLQSERLFQAVKGLGGRARLVLLPYESHSYAARENILHMLWEQDTWLEKWVKGAKE